MSEDLWTRADADSIKTPFLNVEIGKESLHFIVPPSDAAQLTVHGKVYCTGVDHMSDERVKTEKLTKEGRDHLAKIMEVKLREYNYKSGVPGQTSESQLGVYAQEIAKVIPEAVHVVGDLKLDMSIEDVATGIKTDVIKDLKVVDYNRLFIENVGATQQLGDMVKDHDDRIRSHDERISALEEKVRPTTLKCKTVLEAVAALQSASNNTGGGAKTLLVAKMVGKASKKEVNPELYMLEAQGFITKVVEIPPAWQTTRKGRGQLLLQTGTDSDADTDVQGSSPATAIASAGKLHGVPQTPNRLCDVAHADRLHTLEEFLVHGKLTSVGISSESTAKQGGSSRAGSNGGDSCANTLPPPPPAASATASSDGGSVDGARAGGAASAVVGAAADNVLLPNDPVAVRGFGGAGKTVLAIRVCNQKAVQSRFKDGIFWINVGQHADGKTEQSVMRQTCALLLKESAADSAAAQKGGMLDAIRDAAAGRSCLFCFDDVWDASDVNKITHAIQSVAPGSKILLTTRDAEVTRDLDGSEFPIAELSPEAAAAMLKSCARKEVVSAWDPGTADLVAKSCGYLPALLAVIGRVLTPTAGKCSLQNMPKLLAQALRDVDRKAQSSKALNLFGYQHKTIVACLKVGVDALDADLREKHVRMSVFPEDAVMPFHALHLLWGHGDTDDTRDAIEALCDKSLLHVGRRVSGWANLDGSTDLAKGEAYPPTPIEMTMHNLQYRYLREEHSTAEGGKADATSPVGQCWDYFSNQFQPMRMDPEQDFEAWEMVNEYAADAWPAVAGMKLKDPGQRRGEFREWRTSLDQLSAEQGSPPVDRRLVARMDMMQMCEPVHPPAAVALDDAFYDVYTARCKRDMQLLLPLGKLKLSAAPPGTRVTVVLLASAKALKYNSRKGIVVEPREGQPAAKVGRAAVLIEGEVKPIAFKLKNLRTACGDKELVLRAVSDCGLQLAFASPDLQNDRDVVLAAVQNNAMAMMFVPANSKLRCDPSVVAAASVSRRMLAATNDPAEREAWCRLSETKPPHTNYWALMLGALHEAGKTVAKKVDMEAAIEHYSRAATLGNAAAAFRVAGIYRTGRSGVSKDYAKSLEFYRMALANYLQTETDKRLECRCCIAHLLHPCSDTNVQNEREALVVYGEIEADHFPPGKPIDVATLNLFAVTAQVLHAGLLVSTAEHDLKDDERAAAIFASFRSESNGLTVETEFLDLDPVTGPNINRGALEWWCTLNLARLHWGSSSVKDEDKAIRLFKALASENCFESKYYLSVIYMERHYACCNAGNDGTASWELMKRWSLKTLRHAGPLSDQNKGKQEACRTEFEKELREQQKQLPQ